METKICSCCKTEKKLDMFYNYKKSKDGKKTFCKECSNKKRNEYIKTEYGFILSKYSSLLSSSKTRGHDAPSFTKHEFYDWVVKNKKFKKLFKEYKESGYDTNKAPSIDRINDLVGYSFENIRIITWKENREKNYVRVKNGIDRRATKRVVGVDMMCNVIYDYFSAKEAERNTGYDYRNISDCCNGKSSHSKGVRWFFYKDIIIKNGIVCDIEPVGVLKLNDKLEIVDHRMKTTSFDGMCSSNICFCCKNKNRTYKGFYWRKAKDYYSELGDD